MGSIVLGAQITRLKQVARTGQALSVAGRGYTSLFRQAILNQTIWPDCRQVVLLGESATKN